MTQDPKTATSQAGNVVPIHGQAPNPETAAPELPPFGALIRIGKVCEITTLSRAQIYKLARLGQFPKPIKLSENTSVWDSSDVYQFIEARKQAALGGAV
ncbi:helix-turn-helix transcriptional regulator [Thiomicrorhabdus xiamenensis]|uniref:AlpA family phage regulatory protein n=1 Tax=Thiomicrorhabdus xiamenensis TaxID=2739063 RepID=A0A7D4SNX6_9GAMM|nr:AlpA family phage regulatory protein [Thiomicrorhabdus xiamenensis]QKI89921.1 AlpA family phage regulatory protein [Thiomicrorhabdus xiamenensis]